MLWRENDGKSIPLTSFMLAQTSSFHNSEFIQNFNQMTISRMNRNRNINVITHTHIYVEYT